MIDHSVNSLDWWEAYFAGPWEANDGPAQTRHFMERLIASLPAVDRHYLEISALSVLDWGCAFGDGVEALASAFPRCRVVGLDFAERAIQEARKRFPGREFIHSSDDRVRDAFDVVVVSNCLEHFTNPFEIAAGHLLFCKALYAILVPYAEPWPLCESHAYQFVDDSFPETLGNFTCIHSAVVTVDQRYWTGDQILVLYGAPLYVDARAAHVARYGARAPHA